MVPRVVARHDDGGGVHLPSGRPRGHAARGRRRAAFIATTAPGWGGTHHDKAQRGGGEGKQSIHPRRHGDEDGWDGGSKIQVAAVERERETETERECARHTHAARGH